MMSIYFSNSVVTAQLRTINKEYRFKNIQKIVSDLQLVCRSLIVELVSTEIVFLV